MEAASRCRTRRTIRGQIGCISVMEVAHLSSTVRLSADAMVEMEAAFDELEPKLRAQAAGQLRGRGADWEVERRQGVVAQELIAVAAGIRDARPGQSVVIGSSRMPLTAWSVRSPSVWPVMHRFPRDRAIGSRCSKPRPGPGFISYGP